MLYIYILLCVLNVFKIDEQAFKAMDMPVCSLGPYGALCYGYYYRKITCIGGFG